MARHIGVSLYKPSPVYRGVVLFLYSGATTYELKTYTTTDGTEYPYHVARAFGPYGTRGPATSQVTQEFTEHAQRVAATKGEKSYGWYGPYKGAIPELVGFVEEQIPSWSIIPATIRNPSV